MENQLATTEETRPLWKLINAPATMHKFELACGREAGSVMINVINAANTNPEIWECDPQTVITSALNAVAMNLSLVPSMGQATILPYKKRRNVNGVWTEEKRAELVPMVRGIKAMAMRTGKYKILNEFKVYQGQEWVEDQMTGLGHIEGKPTSDKTIGYGAFLRLTNGYEATLYMTSEEVMAHAQKFSPTWNKRDKTFYPNSRWITEFDEQALKTVIKKLIKHKGVISDRDRKLLDQLDEETEWDKETFEAGEDKPVDSEAVEVKQAGITLEDAKNVTNREGVKYGDLPTDKLAYMYNEAKKKQNLTEEQLFKVTAMKLLLDARASGELPEPTPLVDAATELGGVPA